MQHDKKTTRCGYSDYITLPVGKEKYSLKQGGWVAAPNWWLSLTEKCFDSLMSSTLILFLVRCEFLAVCLCFYIQEIPWSSGKIVMDIFLLYVTTKKNNLQKKCPWRLYPDLFISRQNHPTLAYHRSALRYILSDMPLYENSSYFRGYTAEWRCPG